LLKTFIKSCERQVEFLLPQMNAITDGEMEI
jgi:hypothetical protein